MVPDATDAGQRRPPPDPFAAARPLLHWTGKRGGATTLRIMRAMEAARTGHVVDLWNPEGSLALAYESGATAAPPAPARPGRPRSSEGRAPSDPAHPRAGSTRPSRPSQYQRRHA